MAERADLDAIIHLGDYYYEYGNDPDDDRAASRTRAATRNGDPRRLSQTLGPMPPGSRSTGAPSTTRLSSSSGTITKPPTTPGWGAHRITRHPIPVANSPVILTGEGDWSDRVAAARQAFFEWIPIRDNAGPEAVSHPEVRRSGRHHHARHPHRRPRGAAGPAWVQTRRARICRGRSWAPSNKHGCSDQLQSSSAKWKVLGNQVLMSLWKLVADTYKQRRSVAGVPSAQRSRGVPARPQDLEMWWS